MCHKKSWECCGMGEAMVFFLVSTWGVCEMGMLIGASRSEVHQCRSVG